MSAEQMTVAEEARLDYARSVGANPVYMADYDHDAIRRSTYEQSVIRRRAEAEQRERNGGGTYTFVNDYGHKVKVERFRDVLTLSVVNDLGTNAYGLISLPDSSAIGLAAAILAHGGHEHLAAGLQAGVQ